MNLGFFDTSILVAYVAGLAAIGWWAAHRTGKTTEDYLLASRSIPWLVTTASYFMTMVSAITLVGTPAEGYRGDYRYLLSNGGDICGAIFISSIFLPHFQKLRVTSIYQAVAERFGPSTRSVCAGYFLLTRTLATSIRIVAISKVLEVATDGKLSYATCVLLVVGTVLGYTTMGGGRAIAWTNLLQFTLLMIGVLSSLVYLIWHVPGGISTIVHLGEHAVRADGTIYNKFNFLELAKPPNVQLLFLMVIWGLFNSSASYGTDQDTVQRLLACNDSRKARWSLLAWGLGSVPLNFTLLSIGACLYAYAHFHPELVVGVVDNDHVFPRFILTTMPHGLRGLLLAAIASVAMGSANSALGSLSTAFTVDFYKRFWGKNADDAHCVTASKRSFVGFGILFILFAYGLHHFDNLLWLSFRITSFTFGPLLGVFLVAILTNWKVRPCPLIALMVTWTLLTLGTTMVAWWASTHGASGFWVDLHKTYWHFYVILGALLIPFAVYWIRET